MGGAPFFLSFFLLFLSLDGALRPTHPPTQQQQLSKRRVYAEQGVPQLWFVDPISRPIDILRLSGDLYSIVDTFGGEDKARMEPCDGRFSSELRTAPFDAIELDLAVLWLPDSPPE